MPRDDGGGNLLDALAHPAQVNLLGAYANANQIAAGIWHNRRNQADQLAGEAFQGSLNPDGTPNQSQLNINLRNAGPGAALAAQDSSQKGQTLDQGTFVTHMARLTSLSGASIALASQYPNGVPQEAVNAEIDQQASKLGLSPADVARAKSQFSNDPAANSATIFRNHVANLQAQQALIATQPDLHLVSAGGTIEQVNMNPRVATPAGVHAPGQPVTQTPSPEQLDREFKYKDDKGAEQTTTYRQWLTDHGFSVAGTPGATTPGAGGLPPSLRNPKNQPAPGAPAASPKPVQTAPAPADITQQETAARQSAAGFQSISDQSVQARTQSAVLGNMLADTTQFTTGPLADRIARVRAIAGRFGLPVDKEATGANESFNKLAAQLANAQGAGSDARLNVNVAANPHADLSPAGVDLMLRQLQGNADYLQARAKLASSYGDQKNIAGFEQEHGAKLDPRAFQFARMTVPQRQSYVKAMSADDRKSVQSSYNYVHGLGLVGG